MDIEARCLELLREVKGAGARFREGQLDAIVSVVSGRRTLVVQKTGWGKSLVYFTSARLLREQGGGMTVVISPLLVLMDNQRKDAREFGLSCEVINYASRKERGGEITGGIKKGKYDLIFTTPESLFDEKVLDGILSADIGLLVVDEAHCISDWGHDFRLEYGKLNRILKNWFQSTPLLATTATANDRVVEDIKKQLGEDIFVSRGALNRDSLYITALKMLSPQQRYAFILKTLKGLDGSGIIYCLTRKDCARLTAFLVQNGVNAVSYYSGQEENPQAEIDFYDNKIKVLVATVALGMGYNKPDVAFVIHYQLPQNPVSYYQQIGRAGRSLDRAYAILLHGGEDEEIIDGFIKNAFPKRYEVEAILDVLEKKGAQTINELMQALNMRERVIEKALRFLENDGAVMSRGGSRYGAFARTANKYAYDDEKYASIMEVREREKQQLLSMLSGGVCYANAIRNCLDDKTDETCGRCGNCDKDYKFDMPTEEEIRAAYEYIHAQTQVIEPRKRYADKRLIPRSLQNLPGLCLTEWGDPGYGQMVKDGKYKTHEFCDKLVEKSAEILKPAALENKVDAVTCVPSLRSDLVKTFAQKVADRLGLPFMELLIRSGKFAKPQKEMQNGFQQAENAFRAFSAVQEVPKSVILIDDMVDSRWTLTACGLSLLQNGCAAVFPFALADSGRDGVNNE